MKLLEHQPYLYRDLHEDFPLKIATYVPFLSLFGLNYFQSAK